MNTTKYIQISDFPSPFTKPVNGIHSYPIKSETNFFYKKSPVSLRLYHLLLEQFFFLTL